MSGESSADPLDALAEEFLARRRGGEDVSVEEFASEHPDLAERILDLFPTLLLLEHSLQDEEEAPRDSGAFAVPRDFTDDERRRYASLLEAD